MTLKGRGPWVASVGLHVAAGTALFLLLAQPQEEPSVLRMHFVAKAGSPAAARASMALPNRQSATAEPALPQWQPVVPAAPAPPPPAVAATLEELLGPAAPETSEQSGWNGPEGLGYAPPPLPPPGLSPPQGAAWVLRLGIPAGGGFAESIEGLDSGHTALDRWLEEYLRTVSFPSSPDGQSYQVRWNLRLASGRPR